METLDKALRMFMRVLGSRGGQAKRCCVALVMCLLVGLWAGPARAQPFAYISNFTGDTVSVIDATTNTVVATVLVGSGPLAFGDFIGPAPTAQIPALSPVGQALVVLVIFLSGLLFLQRRLSPTG